MGEKEIHNEATRAAKAELKSWFSDCVHNIEKKIKVFIRGTNLYLSPSKAFADSIQN